ncbi:glycosyltransferase [Alphaproteobacteria bacterium]|nr:glycosyltransferase [Alphaproteobacteria bacterium]
MNKFSIVIPAFNEGDNLNILIDEIINSVDRFKYKYEIIIVDDCSQDNTLPKIDNKIKKYGIVYLKNQVNLGQSSSIYNGIIKAKFSNILTIDADLQNDPRDINKLCNIYFSNEKFGLVAGIRKKRKDKYIKILSSKIANSIRSFILNDGCQDTGCSLKIFKKNIFLNFEFFTGIHRFLPALFKNKNLLIEYVNVNHRVRLHGISNYGTFSRLLWGIRDLIKVKKMINKIQDD